MTLEMQVAQVVGLSDDTRWSQTAFKDNIVVALELTSDGSFSAKTQGDTFLTLLIELLKKRQPQDKQAFQRLITQYISASVIQSHIKSLIVGMIGDNSIYLFCKSSGTAVLKRGDVWAEVVSGEGLVSGSLKDQDILVCTTQTFNKLLSNKTVMEKFTSEESPRAASEKLGSLLHNFDNSKGAAAVFAFFQKAKEQDMDQAETLTTEETIPPLPIPKKQDEVIPKKQLKTVIFIKEKLGNVINKLRFTFLKKETFVQDQIIGYNAQSTVAFLQSPKKKVLFAALVLMGVLAVSMFWGFGTDRKAVKNTEIEGRLETITHQIEEGEGLVDLNNLRSKTLLSEAESSLLTLSEQFKKGSKERIRIDDLLARAQNALALVVKAYKIDNPSLFLDLTIVKEGASSQDISLYENKLAILDSQNISIISSDVENQSSLIVGGGSKTPNPKRIASHGNNVFVATSDGLVKIDTVSKNQQVVVKNLKDVGEVTDMVAYAGNVYVLDGATKKIWKFMALEGGYSEAQSYLPQGETLGLIPVSLAIDGSVWVLGEGRVIKYTKGAPESFSLQGLDTPLVNATVIYTDDTSQNLYILDKGGGRVVVFDKQGIYSSQYLWSGIAGVTDMVVAEKAKKILLLSGSLIYAIDLK